MKASENCVCLNQKCPAPLERIFNNQTINSHRKCNPWILSLDGPSNPLPSFFFPLEDEITINFQAEGVSSINDILKLNQWPDQLSEMFEKMKVRILILIEEIKKQKIKQFKRIYQKARAADGQIKEIITKLKNGDQINVVNYRHFRQIQKQPSLTLYRPQKLNYYFQNTISKQLRNASIFIQSLIPDFYQEQQKRKRLAMQKTNQYFFQSCEGINDKIMKLTTLFRKQMAKAIFDQQLSLFKTGCCLCQASLLSPKEDPTKLGCLQQLLLHFFKSHSKEVYLVYMHRAIRYEAEQVSTQCFLHKILSEKIQEVIIVDRENAGAIEMPFGLGKNKLWIEVVNADNKNLTRGPFIVANSKRKDSSDILITFLIYQMTKSYVSKITLVTKDHFGTTLQEVLGGLYENKLRCMKPQEFTLQYNDGNEMFLQA